LNIKILNYVFLALISPFGFTESALTLQKGALLYSNELSSSELLNNWKMEGPGTTEFTAGWMQMYSPNEQGHHVLWCPMDFADSFIAEWDVQNLKFDAGLVIVFFAAKGINNEDIFAHSLAPRDGTFEQYTLGDIKSYHISYYANAAHNSDRAHANLRKNNTFSLLQEGEKGIPTLSKDVHHIRLIKQTKHIQMFIDNRKVIDYTDDKTMVDNVDIGLPLRGGKIGFRQMQWTKFQYRNFKVWALETPQPQ
jgi:hypothetical protein